MCVCGCWVIISSINVTAINILRPGQDGCHFADDIFKCIFLNGNVRIVLKISLKSVSNYQINNIPTLVEIMAWRRPGDKPLSQLMMVRLPTRICVTRPQWVKITSHYLSSFGTSQTKMPCNYVEFRGAPKSKYTHLRWWWQKWLAADVRKSSVSSGVGHWKCFAKGDFATRIFSNSVAWSFVFKSIEHTDKTLLD